MYQNDRKRRIFCANSYIIWIFSRCKQHFRLPFSFQWASGRTHKAPYHQRRTIAESLEKEGYAVERIYCSSDPESLDGFRVRELDLAFADGTSPHVVEPLYAGACEVFVDLLKHCDIDGLRSVRDDIKSVSADIKKHFSLASCYISSAGTVCNAIRRRGSADHDKLERRTKTVYSRYRSF